MPCVRIPLVLAQTAPLASCVANVSGCLLPQSLATYPVRAASTLPLSAASQPFVAGVVKFGHRLIVSLLSEPLSDAFMAV